MDGATRQMTAEEVIESLFTYHAPGPMEQEKYASIREAAKNLARVIHASCDGGPDRTAALRKLRECVMTANASIATKNVAAGYR